MNTWFNDNIYERTNDGANNGWYHRNETDDSCGPYPTREEAEARLFDYCLANFEPY